jgi:2-polyprenyl-3-methyl-5-hydroxy-6-metoxy-1,4-benzoquinol methylase/glycosyltransferase involved in cell wall biosynthesis
MSGMPKYQSTIDRNNKNNSHTLSIDFIEAGHTGQALRILEVGCSTGYFGAALKELGHTVLGVEMDQTSAELAKKYLDEVHCCTIEAYFEKNPDQLFDVITFGDVLEHLTDTEAILLLAREHLLPSGRLIASIPNVTHASIRCMMLQGDWTYSDLGILDKTHLRFFTKQSVLQLFKACGYSITQIQAIKLSAQQAADMCGLAIQAEVLKLVESIHDDDTLENFQYVICARPTTDMNTTNEPIAPRKRALRILATCDHKESTISKIRLIAPLQGFANEGCRTLRVLHFDATTPSDIKWADVVVIQRGSNTVVETISDQAREAGKPIVYEVDDLITELPDFLSHHQGYINNKKIIEGLIKSATVVTLTNHNLSDALRHLNAESAICPNYYEAQSYPIQPKHDSSIEAEINLVIASSDRVRMDMVSPALIAIKNKYPTRVFIQAIGPIADTLNEQGVICNKLNLVPHEEFIPTVGNYKNAIGIIPLDDSKFSSCKSPVKYFDYSQAGLISICSNVSPYKDIIENNKTGILCNNTTEDWIDQLTRLIEQPALRLEIALNAQKHVRENHSIQKTIDAWKAVFQKIAPGDIAIYIPPPPKAKISLTKSIVRYLKAKNRQRKARRNQRKS